MTFEKERLSWYLDATHPLPDGSYPHVTVPYSEVSALQVDKRAGHMAIWAYEHEVPFARLLGERFQPFAERGTPESSILIEYKWEVSMQGLKPRTSFTLHSLLLTCHMPSAL